MNLPAPIKLFLSGERGAGKSFVIRQVLRCGHGLQAGGFFTIPIFQPRGFALFDLLSGKQAPIGIFRSNGELAPQPEGFEILGVKALREARKNRVELLVMDELGFLELEAPLFRREVLSALNYFPLVLGAIKSRGNPFLTQIRQTPGVRVWKIDARNREEILGRILKIIVA